MLITRRIRSEPPSGANVSPVRRPLRDSSWASVDVEGVDPGRGQREGDVGPLVLLGQPGAHVADLGVVGADDSDSSPTSEKPENSSPSRTIWPTVVIDRSRTGRVIMPAWQNRQPRVQPRKISTAYRSCTVSASGTSGLFGYGHASRSIVVRLCTRNGTSGAVGHDPLDPPVGQVVDVVEARHVDALGAGQPQQQLVAAARASPRPSTPGRWR